MRWKQIVFVIATALLLPSWSHAQVIQDPLAHFIASDFFQEEVKTSDWREIHRVELDLTGDGKKAVFLSTTYTRHAGMDWKVYVPGRRGYTAGFKTQQEESLLSFSPEHCYLGYIPQIKHRGLVFFVGRVVDGFEFIALWIERGRAHVKVIGETKPPKDEVEPDDPLFKKYFPNLDAPDKHPPFAVEALSIDDLEPVMHF